MDWITPAQQLIALITALVGLIGTGVGAFIAIRQFIKNAKTKSASELWNMITVAADAAMTAASKAAKMARIRSKWP